MKVYYLEPQQRNKSKGFKTWFGGVVKNGVTRWVSLKTDKLGVARAWYDKMQATLYAPEIIEPQTVSIADAKNAYLLHIEKVRRRSAGTILLYDVCLRQFCDWCKIKNIKEILEVTAKLAADFAGEKLAHLKGSSARVRVVGLRSFFEWVFLHYDITMRNPFKSVVVSKPKSKPREFWTLEECEKIIEAAKSTEVKCWFAFMAFAGLRKNEARFLKWASIDFEKDKLSVIGKGDKYAALPISERLKNHLAKYIETVENKEGYLFPGLAKMAHNLDRYVKQAAVKANASNAETAHVHRFRHSFASNLLRAGKNIKAVQVLMRHENINLTLDTYSHLLPSDLEKEAEL